MLHSLLSGSLLDAGDGQPGLVTSLPKTHNDSTVSLTNLPLLTYDVLFST
jgi:hypothetical protein